jgi:hypothetical protein
VASDQQDQRDVHWSIAPGRIYRIGMIELKGCASHCEDALQADLQGLMRSVAGSTARADTLRTLCDRIVWRLKESGRPFANARVTAIVRGLPLDLARIVVTAAPGPVARVGQVRIKTSPDRPFNDAAGIVDIRPGEAYDPNRIVALSERLQALARVKRVRVDVASHLNGEGQADVDFTIVRTPDPAVLDRQKPLGRAALAATLLLIVFRQLLAGSASPMARRGRLGLDMLLVVIGCVALALVAQRLQAFIMT